MYGIKPENQVNIQTEVIFIVVSNENKSRLLKNVKIKNKKQRSDLG